MIFWEACKTDNRSYGMQYVKNRRIGASFMAIIECGTINEDKLLGIVSKTGADSSKIFKRLIKGFRRLPCFFQPLWTEQMHRRNWYWTYPRKEPK
jgi:hypothetical protein